jgi:sugar phosphate isomerase/epimerase
MGSIGVQLYSVREQIKASTYEAIVTKIAEMGYAGVEPAGFPGTDAVNAGKIFKKLGLKVPSAHTGLPVGENKNKVLDEMAAIGSRIVISGKGPDDFKDADTIKKTCDLFNQAAAAAKERKMQFGIHNHWWEFSKVGDKLAFDLMLQNLSKDVLFEIDTYWCKTGGANPVAIVKQLGKRTPLLHIKDGPCVQGQPMTAVGKGKMDFPAIIAVAKDVQWHIVELDSCATDMMVAVKESCDYLKKIVK